MRFGYLSALSLFVVFAGCQSEIITQTPGSSGTSSSSSSNSSGMGGSGGISGSGGTGGNSTSPLPECTSDSDCTLVNDCCTCASLPNGTPFPDCSVPECFATTCNADGLGQPTAVCRAGHCVVDADCNQTHVLCKSLPPECPPGQTPIVVNDCWGGCIDIVECREIGDCTQCLDGQACVTSNTMMIPGKHCVDVPDSCNGQISCACMGENVCGFAQGCYQPSPTEIQCLDITTK